MKKFVIYRDYGGFNLPFDILFQYGQLAGLHNYEVIGTEFPHIEYTDYNGDRKILDSWNIKRDDKILVKLIEEMQDTPLKVFEIPNELDFEIHEYDGYEVFKKVLYVTDEQLAIGLADKMNLVKQCDMIKVKNSQII